MILSDCSLFEHLPCQPVLSAQCFATSSVNIQRCVRFTPICMHPCTAHRLRLRRCSIPTMASTSWKATGRRMQRPSPWTRLRCTCLKPTCCPCAILLAPAHMAWYALLRYLVHEVQVSAQAVRSFLLDPLCDALAALASPLETVRASAICTLEHVANAADRQAALLQQMYNKGCRLCSCVLGMWMSDSHICQHVQHQAEAIYAHAYTRMHRIMTPCACASQASEWGDPFLVKVHKSETFGELKQRLWERLKAEPEAAAKWELAILPRPGTPQYPADEDIIFEVLSRRVRLAYRCLLDCQAQSSACGTATRAMMLLQRSGLSGSSCLVGGNMDHATGCAYAERARPRS